jgi:hypothetical protein
MVRPQLDSVCVTGIAEFVLGNRGAPAPLRESLIRRIAELLDGASSGRDRIGVSLGGEVAVLDP